MTVARITDALRGLAAALKSAAPPLLSLLGLLVAWEAVSREGLVPAFLLPAPSAVFAYASGHLDLLWKHAQATAWASALGFAFACVGGIAIAIAMVWSAPFERAVFPIIVMSQVVPKVAIAPLVVVYMGFGMEPKILLAFIVSFFPMVINTALGMRSVDPELLELLVSLRLTRWQILWKVRWFAALPAITEAAKVSITLAVIGAIVGEFAAGNLGLGFLINSSAVSANMPLTFSTLFTLIVMGIAMFQVLTIAGQLLTPWVKRRAETAMQIASS